VLRKRLRAARTYQESLPTYKTRVSLYLPQEWKDAAKTLDEFLHFHEWKRVDEDPFYDWKLVRKVCFAHGDCPSHLIHTGETLLAVPSREQRYSWRVGRPRDLHAHELRWY
jgi:hypothetical protein